MASMKTIVLFGSQSARDAARSLLENQPQIRRVDSSGDMRTLRLIITSPIEEISLISLLSASGISGFRLM